MYRKRGDGRSHLPVVSGSLLASPPTHRYDLRLMNHDVTQLLSALGQGDPHAASRLLPLVYDELRRLAAQRRLIPEYKT